MLALTDSALAPLYHLRHGPRPDRRPRGLELLASCRDGRTESILLAHGFTVEQMVELLRAGLATATAERVVRARVRSRFRAHSREIDCDGYRNPD